MAITYTWRGPVENEELNRLHAEAFETRVYTDDEWNWIGGSRDTVSDG